MVTLTLPLPPNAANARRNWRVALAQKKAFWTLCDNRVLVQATPQPPTAPIERVRVFVCMYVGNYMDADNAMARLKPAIDWLVRSGYIVDDGRKHMEWAGVPEQVIDRKNPRIVITLEEA